VGPPRKHSPDGATETRWNSCYDSFATHIYRPRKDERLSWPSWLTSSGRFAHIVVTRRLQAERRTGSVRRPQQYCATQPTVRNQHVRSLRVTLNINQSYVWCCSKTVNTTRCKYAADSTNTRDCTAPTAAHSLRSRWRQRAMHSTSLSLATTPSRNPASLPSSSQVTRHQLTFAGGAVHTIPSLPIARTRYLFTSRWLSVLKMFILLGRIAYMEIHYIWHRFLAFSSPVNHNLSQSLCAMCAVPP